MRNPGEFSFAIRDWWFQPIQRIAYEMVIYIICLKLQLDNNQPVFIGSIPIIAGDIRTDC